MLYVEQGGMTMAFYGITDFSSISGSLGKSSASADLFSSVSSYKQARAVKSAITTLHSSQLSAKNSKEQASVTARLKTITDSIKGQSTGSTTSFTTSSGESTITALAKEAGEKMYQEATGTGTNIDTTV